MEKTELNVQTVLGVVSPKSLGITLTHEHFSMDFSHYYCEAPLQLESYVADREKISLKNLGVLRQYPYSSRYNLSLEDEEAHRAVLEDVRLFKKWGGGTIVENTTHGLHRNLDFAREVAVTTGVNVVAGTGHYIAAMQTESERCKSIEAIADIYTKEIITGVDVKENGRDFIKCGFIGEVGSGWPIADFERRAIRAAAEVQDALGCGVSFHPSRDPEAPFEIIRFYLEAGGNADKCVMSHLDRTILDDDQLMEFAKLGVYNQFDLFGTEVSYYQLKNDSDMPSDADRMDKVVLLVKEGYEKRVLLSHDIHTKHRLMPFGGHGYAHIINNVLPKFITKGLTDEQIDQITVSNPADWLQFNV